MSVIDCPHCGKKNSDHSFSCFSCGQSLTSEPAEISQPLKKPPNGRVSSLICTHCGGEMVKKTISSGNVSGILFGLIMVVVGFAVVVALPGVGWVIGPLIILWALFQGGKRRRVWKCRNCSSIVDRA